MAAFVLCGRRVCYTLFCVCIHIFESRALQVVVVKRNANAELNKEYGPNPWS